MNAPLELAPEGATLRSLHGLERFTALGNAHFRSCFNVVTMLEVEGPLTLEVLTEAAARVQQRFECLQVEVVDEPGRPGHFVFRTTRQLPRLEVIDAKTPDGWREVWRELTHAPLSGLAWRLFWVRHPGSPVSQLLVGCHHAISDARSTSLLFGGLLEAARDVVNGVTTVVPVERFPAAVAATVKSQWPVRGLLSLVWHRYFRRLRALPLEPAKPLPPEARGWGGVFRERSPEATQALVERCRAEGLSVGQALSAAMLLEVADRARRAEALTNFVVALTTTMDLRRLEGAGMHVGQMGLLVSAVHSYYPVRDGETVWELGRRVKESVAALVARNEHRDFARVHHALGPWAARYLANLNQGRPREAALVISNFGQLDDLSQGPFEARRFFITAAQSLLGAALLLACGTLRGSLFLHLGYPTPAVLDETGEQVMDGALQRVGLG